MTKENVRRLFKHYTEVGNKAALANLVDRRPWVAEEAKPKVEVKNGKKSKG